MDRSRAVPGGLLYELTNPSLSPRDLAVAMILQSDNTATNVLIDRVGMAAVNRRMAALGLADTELRRHMIDLEAARRGDENVSTPADLARLVLAFHRGEGLIGPLEGASALEILQKSKRTPDQNRRACRGRRRQQERRAGRRPRRRRHRLCAGTAVRVCRDGDVPARRRRSPLARSTSSRASATSTSAAGRR